MDDAKRFFRYLVPGVVPLVELALLVIIANHKRALDWPGKSGGALSGFGGAALALLAAPGFGYIFSTVHHFVMWRWHRWPYGDAGHGRWFKEAEEAGLVELRLRPDGRRPDRRLSPCGAWRVMCVLWYEQLGAAAKGKSRLNEEVQKRQESMSDLAQGAGAVFVGSIFAFIALVVFLWTGRWSPGNVARTDASLIIGLIALATFGANAAQLLRHAYRMPEMVLWDSLRETASTVRLWVGESELEPPPNWLQRWWHRWHGGNNPERPVAGSGPEAETKDH